MSILAAFAARLGLKGAGALTMIGGVLAAVCLTFAAGVAWLGSHDSAQRREAAAAVTAECKAGVASANATALARALKRAADAERSAAEERTRAEALDAIATRSAAELGEHMMRLNAGQAVCVPVEISRMLNR